MNKSGHKDTLLMVICENDVSQTCQCCSDHSHQGFIFLLRLWWDSMARIVSAEIRLFPPEALLVSDTSQLSSNFPEAALWCQHGCHWNQEWPKPLWLWFLIGECRLCGGLSPHHDHCNWMTKKIRASWLDDSCSVNLKHWSKIDILIASVFLTTWYYPGKLIFFYCVFECSALHY